MNTGMRDVGRTLTSVGALLLVAGLAAWLLGVVISQPFATGLGFLALGVLAGTAVPLLAAGAVLRLVAARDRHGSLRRV